MDAKAGDAFERAGNFTSKSRVLGAIKTNLPAEIGIAATLGTPTAQWARAYSRGEMTRSDNRRWGEY